MSVVKKKIRLDKIFIHFALLFFLTMSLMVSPGVVHAQITNLSSAINKAGRQRMLSQRILKAYAMIGIDVMTDRSQQQLDEAQALYERQLDELQVYSPNNKTTKTIRNIRQIWKPYTALLQKPVARKNANALFRANEKLLAASHKLVMQLQEVSGGSSHARLVNISGRQRMLSQRLAKFYMFKSWGLNSPEYQKKSEKARTEFDTAMGELIRAPENTPEIKQALAKAKSQWDLFQYGLERNKKKLVPLIVATTSEQLLKSMNVVTDLYEVLLTKITLLEMGQKIR